MFSADLLTDPEIEFFAPCAYLDSEAAFPGAVALTSVESVVGFCAAVTLD